MIESDLLARLQVEILLGVPPEKSLVPDTEEYRAIRQALEAEIQARPGVMWDIPFEWPDVEIPKIGMPDEQE